MISNIQNLYSDSQIPTFNEPINYYKYLSAQVAIKDNIILFSIYTPIILPIQFALYKIFPIPILNQTISASNPYILLTKESYWTTKEECPQLEDIFICHQRTLSKDEPCLHKLLTTTRNDCPMTNIHYTRTSVQRLNGEQILVIPFKETIIQNKCQQGIYVLKQSSIVTIPNCPIEIEYKVYQKEKKTKFEYVLDLPKFTSTSLNTTLPKLQLEEVNLEELNKAQKILSAVQFHLDSPGITISHWVTPVAVLSLIAISLLAYFLRKSWKTKTSQKSNQRSPAISIHLDDRKISQPLFSELTEGGDI